MSSSPKIDPRVESDTVRKRSEKAQEYVRWLDQIAREMNEIRARYRAKRLAKHDAG